MLTLTATVGYDADQARRYEEVAGGTRGKVTVIEPPLQDHILHLQSNLQPELDTRGAKRTADGELVSAVSYVF